MNDRDAETFARFARRYAGIEAQVGDAPALPARRHVRPEHERRLAGVVVGLAAAVVALVALGALAVGQMDANPTVPPAPTASVLAAEPSQTPGATPVSTASATDTPPVVVCGRLAERACAGAIELVRDTYGFVDMAATRAIVVDDACSPVFSVCDRVYAFMAVVVVVTAGDPTPHLSFSVVGQYGPEFVSRARAPIPAHIAALIEDLPASTAPPSTDPATPTADLELAQAFRRAVGLRAERDYAAAVARDPRAGLDFGVPLLPSEREALSAARAPLDETRQVIEAYGEANAEAWAGTWVGGASGRTWIVNFTRDVELHGLVLSAKVSSTVPLEARRMRWTLRDLERLEHAIARDEEWLMTLPAVLTYREIDVRSNRILIGLSSENPRAVDLLTARHDAAGKLDARSDGTGIELVPTGTLTVRAVDSDGQPVPNLQVWLYGVRPGSPDGPMEAYTDRSGEAVVGLPESEYEVLLKKPPWRGSTYQSRTAGSSHATVVGGQATQVDIVVDGDVSSAPVETPDRGP